jgi:aryl-alcohol dehydrogenase-like predicted oxidoreductase
VSLRGAAQAGSGGTRSAGCAAVEQLKKIAARAGLTMSRFALAWVLSNPAITAVNNGITSIAQLEENATATEVQLPGEVLAACDEVWLGLRPPLTVFYGR